MSSTSELTFRSVVAGAKSKYINRHNIPLLEKFFPNMQLKTLDAGHWGEFDPLNDTARHFFPAPSAEPSSPRSALTDDVVTQQCTLSGQRSL